MDFQEFAAIFNENSMEAFEYMKSKTEWDNDNLIDEFAKCMLLQPELDKTKIGIVLSGTDKTEKSVTKSYFRQLDIKDLVFDEALRKLLLNFHMPTEAQKIDRIMTLFAASYWTQNPTILPDADALYVLAYSLTILSSDAHSEHIPDEQKMTKAQFLQNIGTLVIVTLPEDQLSSMYDRIVSKKLPTDNY